MNARGSSDDFSHAVCGAHVLQVLVRCLFAIPLVAMVIACVHELVMYINTAASSDRLGKFVDVAKAMLPEELRVHAQRLLRRPPVAGQTRWCGTKGELEFTVNHYELLKLFYSHFGPEGSCRTRSTMPCPPIPTLDELHLISFVLKILTPFEESTKALQLPHATPVVLEAYMRVFGPLLGGFGLENDAGLVEYQPCNDPGITTHVKQIAQDSIRDAQDAARGFPVPRQRIDVTELEELDMGPEPDEDDDEDAPILDLVFPASRVAQPVPSLPPLPAPVSFAGGVPSNPTYADASHHLKQPKDPMPRTVGLFGAHIELPPPSDQMVEKCRTVALEAARLIAAKWHKYYKAIPNGVFVAHVLHPQYAPKSFGQRFP